VAEHAELEVGGKNSGDTPEFPLRPPIVAVEKDNDIAAAFRNASIECGGLAAVLFADQADTRFELTNDFRSAVRRTIVHHNDLETVRRIVLIEHAAQGLVDEALMIVGVNKDAEKHD
jgi:hypothetical protein